MTTVAVTGASGFVGGAVVRRLRASGHEIHAFGRRSLSRVDNGVGAPYAAWDITQGPLPDPPRVDAVVHCAAAVDDWGRSTRFEAVNVRGTEHVLATWPRARFVHVSSSSIYDPARAPGPVPEDAADPRDGDSIQDVEWLGHYGRTKRLAEHVVSHAAPARSIILRPRAVYGPGDRTLLPRLLGHYRAGRLIVAGRPDTHLSVTFIENLTSAIACALRSGATGAFNVADAEPVRLGSMLEDVLSVTGRRARVTYLPVGPLWALATVAEAIHLHGFMPRPVVTRFELAQVRGDFVLDTSRARDELSWSPHVSTAAGIRTLAEVHDERL